MYIYKRKALNTVFVSVAKFFLLICILLVHFQLLVTSRKVDVTTMQTYVHIVSISARKSLKL